MESNAAADGAGASGSRAWIVATLVALAPYLWLVRRFDWLCDDAYISFRYSRHLAEGHGLVFNLGEAPRVEGFSNLLWVLVLAPCEALGIDLGVAARVLSIACGVALIALVARALVRRFGLDAWRASACTLLFAALPSVAVWSTSGLETMAFALTVFGLFERLEAALAGERRAARTAAAWAAAAVLVRADGVLWAAAVVGVALIVARGPSLRERLRALAPAALATALAVAALVGWRLAYYGLPLPNTAYAKAGFSTLRLERGWDYVASYGLTVPVCALLPLAALALPGARRHPTVLRACALVLFAALYAAWTGGDFMAMGRFFVPVMALEALLLGAVLAALRERGPALAAPIAAAAIGLALLPAFDVHPVPASLRERFHFRWSNPEKLTEYEQWSTMKERFAKWDATARALASFTKPGESIVFGAVGSVGYRTELVVYDPLGLVTPEVARRAVEPKRASPGHDLRVKPEFFVPRKPDYLDAFLVPADAPALAGIQPEWRNAPWSPRMRVERHALAAEQGFDPGTELRLVRLDWSH